MSCENELLIFCHNIRYLRKRHGLSKMQMAKILGIGVKSLTSMEKGVLPRRMGASVLYRACVYFQISCDAFFRPMEE